MSFSVAISSAAENSTEKSDPPWPRWKQWDQMLIVTLSVTLRDLRFFSCKERILLVAGSEKGCQDEHCRLVSLSKKVICMWNQTTQAAYSWFIVCWSEGIFPFLWSSTPKESWRICGWGCQVVAGWEGLKPTAKRQFELFMMRTCGNKCQMWFALQHPVYFWP